MAEQADLGQKINLSDQLGEMQRKSQLLMLSIPVSRTSATLLVNMALGTLNLTCVEFEYKLINWKGPLIWIPTSINLCFKHLIIGQAIFGRNKILEILWNIFIVTWWCSVWLNRKFFNFQWNIYIWVVEDKIVHTNFVSCGGEMLSPGKFLSKEKSSGREREGGKTKIGHF